jgi:hypothetical protein
MSRWSRWFAGSKYLDIMQRTCTAGTLMFLLSCRSKRSSHLPAEKNEGRPNYFFQKAKMSHTKMSAICPAILGPLADEGDPFLRECDYNLLKDLEKSEARRAAKDVTVE